MIETNPNSKPVNKDNVLAVANKLKEVLNPTQWIAENINSDRVCFKLSTDLQPSADITLIISGISDDDKIILFNGNIYSGVIAGINKGSQKIKCIGCKIEDGKLQIIISTKAGPSDTSEVSLIRKILVEIFAESDNKNHCTEIVPLSNFPNINYTTQFAGEDPSNWEFKIDSGDEKIEINPQFTGTITKIKESETADKLANNITFNISGTVVASSSSTLDFDSNPSSVDLTVNVDTQTIENLVNTAVASKDIPAASTVNVGGFKVYGGSGSPQKATNQCVVKMDSRNEYNYAYIDTNDLSSIINQDIHRYSDMSLATGGIVQYIGQTTPQYIRGYFYQYTPTNFNVSTLNEKWEFITTAAATGQAIANYNIEIDYLISSGELKFEMVPENGENWIISDNSIFIISQNNAELVRLNYADVKSTFGIRVKDSYLSDTDNTLILNLLVPSGAQAWKQKNVQPMMKVGSPLVYKGTITSNQGETDIEALERQVNNPEVGDFYIVKPSNQEYCWIDGDDTTPHWEFMGDIFDPYTGGDGISINSNHDISVKYDNDTIKKNGSGNLYVDGELTDTTYTAGDNIEIDANDSNKISVSYPKVLLNIDKDFEFTSTIVALWDFTQELEHEGLEYILTNRPIEFVIEYYDGNEVKSYTELGSGECILTLDAEGSDTGSYIATAFLNDFALMYTGDFSGFPVYDDVHVSNRSVTKMRIHGSKPDWNAIEGDAGEILNKPNLATVATSGSYTDLTDKPTIPTITSHAAKADTSTDNQFLVSKTSDSSGYQWQTIGQNGVYVEEPRIGDHATTTLIVKFTANESKNITIKQGNNITLTPDAGSKKITISATDTTYNAFGGSGSNHSSGLVPDPGSTAGTSKYLCEDGTWSTPPTTSGLTGVTFNGTSATVSGGVAAITAEVGTVIPAGTIQMYAGAGDTVPSGWLLCNGDPVNVDLINVTSSDYDFITNYQGTSSYWKIPLNSIYRDLLLVIKGTYTNAYEITQTKKARVPNFNGRFPLGVGNSSTTGSSSHSLGSSGGTEKVTLIESELPDHQHTILCGGYGTADTEGNGVAMTTGTGTESKYYGNNNKAHALVGSVETPYTQQAHDNMPPYLTVNFIIKY